MECRGILDTKGSPICITHDCYAPHDLSQICNQCGKSVQAGSGRFVNRIPSFWGVGEAPFDSDWMCAECQAIECEECSKPTIEYEIVDNAVYCGDCLTKLGLAD